MRSLLEAQGMQERNVLLCGTGNLGATATIIYNLMMRLRTEANIMKLVEQEDGMSLGPQG